MSLTDRCGKLGIMGFLAGGQGRASVRVRRTQSAILIGLVLAAAGFCLPVAAQPRPLRRPVPDAQELSQAEALFREIYQQEIDAADTTDKKSSAAKRFLDQALKARGAPADQYVLLREAAGLAAGGGDAETAISAVNALAERFDVDAWEARLETLSEVAASVKFTSQKKTLAATAAELVDGAMTADLFEPAERLAAIALDAARAARDGPLSQQVAARQEEIQEWKAAYAPVVDALAVLADRPTDPAANRVVGSYRCVWKGDWERGVAMLALGDDPALEKLAAEELRSPASADERVALGDGWWELGESRQERHREAYLKRAAHWYEQALPELSGGLVKMKIERRIDQIAELSPPPAGTEVSGAGESSGAGAWETVDPKGMMTRCVTLGPFPQSQLDVPVVGFIRKAQPGQVYNGLKLTPTEAERAGGQMRFPGPTQPGTKTYYVFLFRTLQTQNVRIRVNTFGAGDYNSVGILVNFIRVPSTIDWLPAKQGSVHVLILKLDHHKGDLPDESWISLSLRGADEPIQQWRGEG